MSSDHASSEVPATPLALTTAAGTVSCSICRGAGHVKADGLIGILQKHEKPVHITFAPPGPAPEGTRWVCFLCPATKEIKTKSADLRLHLRGPPHFFSADDVDNVFDRKHYASLYQYFGPCTRKQADANGWIVRPWKNKDEKAVVEPTEEAPEVKPASSAVASSRNIVFEGSTLRNTLVFEVLTDATTLDDPVSDAARCVVCDASNDYFATHRPCHSLLKSSMLLPATGDQFGDSPFAEVNDIASDIKGFSNDGHAGQRQCRPKTAEAMLGLFGTADGARVSLTAPTSWNNNLVTNIHNNSFNGEHHGGSARCAEREDLGEPTSFDIHCCITCGTPYAFSMPSGSVANDGDVSMVVAGEGHI